METWRRKGKKKRQCRLPELSRGLICPCAKVKSKVLLDTGKVLEGVAQEGGRPLPLDASGSAADFQSKGEGIKWSEQSQKHS